MSRPCQRQQGVWTTPQQESEETSEDHPGGTGGSDDVNPEQGLPGFQKDAQRQRKRDGQELAKQRMSWYALCQEIYKKNHHRLLASLVDNLRIQDCHRHCQAEVGERVDHGSMQGTNTPWRSQCLSMQMSSKIRYSRFKSHQQMMSLFVL